MAENPATIVRMLADFDMKPALLSGFAFLKNRPSSLASNFLSAMNK